MASIPHFSITVKEMLRLDGWLSIGLYLEKAVSGKPHQKLRLCLVSFPQLIVKGTAGRSQQCLCRHPEFPYWGKYSYCFIPGFPLAIHFPSKIDPQ